MENTNTAALALLADGAVTVPEAAAFSGIGRTRLYDLMTAGRLPFVRNGDRRLIPRKALVALLAAGLEGGPVG